MSRLLFATDTMFHRAADGTVLTDGVLRGQVWLSYLDAFDDLIVAGRERPPSRPASVSAPAEADGVSFALLPNFNSPLKLARRIEAARIMAGLVGQSDAVAVRLPTEIGLLAASLARRAGKPLLVEVVGSASEAFRLHGSLLARLYAPVIHRRMQRAVRAADIALYVTQRWLQSQYPSPNVVVDWDDGRDGAPGRVQAGIPDAFVQQPTAAVKDDRARRLKELAEGRTPVFGTMAVLGPRFKGIQFALAAFAQIARSNGLPFQYRILGPGDPRPWQQMIRDLGLQDCCHVDGVRQPGQPVLEWLDNIDVHIQPSLTESLSRSTIEAMSRGVGCLASSAGGLPEYLGAEQLHPPGDAEALAGQISALLANPREIASLSALAFEGVKRFDCDLIQSRRRHLYRRLANMGRVRASHER